MLDDYFRQYGLVAILSVMAVLMPAGILLASWISSLLGIRPRRPNAAKEEIYECGMEPIGGRWLQFHFGYYQFALLFLIFDVLAVLLYPWAVQFRHLGLPALVVVVVFMFLLCTGWIYAWKKGALEWR